MNAEGLPPGTEAILKLWRERLPCDGAPPALEAGMVVDAVLDHLRGALPDRLDAAGRAWGRAERSVLQMLEQLSRLRAVLSTFAEDPARLHDALDKITAVATEEMMARLERASRTDALTGVGNRRAFDESIQATLSAAARRGHEVTVVAVDLDGLKLVNDTQGHAAGDAALISLVRCFDEALRDEDVMFRLGGDEFVIVLPFTSVGAAGALMRRVARSSAPAFTWGAAGYPGDATDAGTLLDVADRDLYQRRGLRVDPMAMTRRRSFTFSRLARTSRSRSRAWLPAAALLAVSLLAIVLFVGPGHPVVDQGGRRLVPGATATTSPAGARHTSPTPRPSTASSAGTAAGASGPPTGPGAVTARFSSPTGSSGPPDGEGSSGTPSGGGQGGSPEPPGGPPPSGGLLGAVNQVLAPVPVVGGNGGLVSIVDQLLTGHASGAAPLGAVADQPGVAHLLLGVLGPR